MYISDIIKNKKFTFSLEIFPPKKDGSIDTIYKTLEALAPIKPDYISVTYGAGGNPADNSTCEIATIIKERYGIEPLVHLTCINSDKKQVDDTLGFLKEKGISNILALRGDRNPDVPPKTDFTYASDLTKYIMNRGGFDVAGACYPETHPEAISMDIDIRNLKTKVDAGASHLVSQLFFDNNDFYNYMYKLRDNGINVPVQAGIMPVTNKKQIERMVSMCGASLPKKFTKIMSKYDSSPEALCDAGCAYAIEQIIDLITNGIDGIHLYTMNRPEIALKIYDSIKNIMDCVNRG
ncbi:MAG: methylenetetrahydrofolate reductase [Clostridia bacterium]|nr:methylenetetrahydrofolate reductase [NAD(P)H] [Clostridia bacterium]